jgi:hypothetical protein
LARFGARIGNFGEHRAIAGNVHPAGKSGHSENLNDTNEKDKAK